VGSEAKAMVNKVRKNRVFLVEDHPVFRQGLSQTINSEPDFIVCGEAGDARKALDTVSEANPDLALVDISLPGMGGIELIKSMKAEFKDLPILVLSMHDELLYAERAIRAGAKGYIMKARSADEIIGAMRHILGGRIYLSSVEEKRMLDKFLGGKPRGGTERTDVSQLSNRELEVFLLIGRGYRTRRIADDLHVSIKTVETHRAHIKEKLGINDSTELARAAVSWVNREQLS